MMQKPSRPIGVTILAVLEILIGIVGLLASLTIIGLSALLSTLPRVGSLLGTFGLVLVESFYSSVSFGSPLALGFFMVEVGLGL